MRPTFSFNPAALPAIRTRKALLVVDPQNDFLSSDGALTVSEPEGFVKRTLELVKEFRDSGAGDVVWVRSEFERHRPLSAEGDQIVTSTAPPRPQRPGSTRGRQPTSREHDGVVMEADEEAFLSVAGGKPAKTCVQKGSHGAEFPSEVQEAVEATRDIVFTKTHYSAFSSAQQELVQRLRGRFVTELYICGALTNISIYATALEAGRHGYDMTIVEDCCGYRSQLRHFNAVRQLVKLTGCEVMNSDVLIEQLQPPAAANATQSHPSGLSPFISNMKLNLAPGGSPETPPATSRHGGPTPSAKTAPPQPDRGANELAASTPPSVKSHPSHPPIIPDDATSVPRPLSDRRHPGPPFEADTDSSPAESESPAGTPAIPIEARRGSAHARTSNVDESKSSKGAPRAPGTPSTKAENPRVKVSARLRLRPSSADKDKKSQLSSLSSSPDKIEPETEPKPAMTETHTEFVCSEPLCEGDTTVITNVLSPSLARDAFERLLDEVSWAGMSHMGGEVPRRIAVQGTVEKDGTMPVYRHPADESPPLLPFSPTVAQIKDEIEKHLGHPLNHVLVQHYRSGNDYISEHSDKTLDVVKGSYICNVSLGAERTMVFRTKRQPKDKTTTKDDSDDAATSGAEKAKRQVQRTPLPHNSLCRMGLKTNEKWVHAIRQDKRSDKEKSASELAYNGQRISLTFRQIGTFIDGAQSRIWGQGATSKTREDAKPVINGQTPEAVRMLQAFGTENHSSHFDRAANYAAGFDVLHMGVPKRVCSGSDPIANTRVAIALGELGVSCAKGSVEGDVRFEDNDASRAVIDGHASVLRYLDAVYGAGRRYDQMLPHVVAKRFGLLQRALDFLDLWKQDRESAEKNEGARSLQRTKKLMSLLVWEEMVFWESKAKEAVSEGKQKDTDEKEKGTAVYICGGSAPSPADFALWPVLHDMVRVLGDNVFDVAGLRGEEKSAYLREYYLAFNERSAVGKVLGVVVDEAK
ncbi:alpha-ketoglutarate-dependent dioxygenase alkB 2 [Cladorrhinum sp. PSN332]|nr:alpha-ketoglutarate-dependent dioxygenase alkB 2 [Cladorrhinum sp. PSN332]